jgi:hypothetical protein
VTEANQPPVLSAVATQTVVEGAPLALQVSATDPDLPVQALAFSLVSGPAGLTVSAAGAVAWTPTEAQGPSTNVVMVRVADDGNPSLSATNTFTVVVTEANQPPVLSAVATQTVVEGAPLALQLSATDPDLPAQALAFGLVSGPAGLTVSAAGAVAWTPTEAQGPSTNVVTVRVADDGNPSLSATNTFIVVVTEGRPTIAFELAADSPGIQFRFRGQPGKRYRLETTETLLPANWVLVRILTPDESNTYSAEARIPEDQTAGYFRVVVE